MSTAESAAVSAAEANSLFADLHSSPGLLLAVSGGPDSTALLVLAARWLKTLKKKPKLAAVTVDHGLRAESKSEAAAVARLAKKLGVDHRIIRWTGKKPAAGLQQAARQARYTLLVAAAQRAGASHIVTAHTLDDQAETVLIRMARGSGITGLGAMRRISVIPGREQSARNDGLLLVRPFLDIPKARLIATLRTLGVEFADDPSNRNPRFTRARLRDVMPGLAREGLDAHRLSVLAHRLRRADAAIEAVVERAMRELAVDAAPGAVAFDAGKMRGLPAEVALRMVGRAVALTGDEGRVELGKLEALMAALNRTAAKASFRRTLAGAMVTFAGNRLVIERAPARRPKPLTKRASAGAKRRKTR